MKTKPIFALITGMIAYGQRSDGQSPDTTTLAPVVVSASKVPRRTDALSQAVTVLNGDDLRARGVVRVSDALREVPGAQLVQSGSFGSLTSLFLRGGESRYTKVLIDGVPVNSAGGFFDFSHLTTDNIDRIEIVRGPASVLYGADAVSGVVQIFTRRGSTRPTASVAARAGTYRTLDGDIQTLGATDIANYSVGAGQHSTDGVLPFNNEYHNGTLSSSFGIGRSDVGEARVSARYTTAEFHYPTDFTGQPVDTNSYRVQHRLTVGLDASRNLSARVQARLLAGTNDVYDLSEDIALPFGSSTQEHSALRSRGYRRNVEGRFALFLPMNTALTVGGVYEREHENSTTGSGAVGEQTTQTDAFDATRHNVGYYAEMLGNPADRVSYTLSGRIDDNSDYARFATYRVGGNIGIVPGLRLRAALSNAFNAPAFSELRPTLYTVGSPDLKPERIHSAEVGLLASVAGDAIHIGGSYFTQRFSDLIQYVNGGPPDYKGSFANLNAAVSNGYEAELQAAVASRWRANASFTVVNPRVDAVDLNYQGTDRAGDALLRRPSHSGSIGVSYFEAGGFNLGTAVTYVGQRPDLDFSQFPSPRVSLPAYTKVDLSGEVPVLRKLPRLTLTARVENLFDKRYEEVLNFAAPGRTILIGGRAALMF
ncbi:MAG TPA: TonB-dependent receptor [Gemmatimonadaceae bacterium]|nr:TonB-dependent receptor [Gemmatimonadaceae bacterium]